MKLERRKVSMGDDGGPRMGLFGKTEAVVFAVYAAVTAFMTWPAITLVSRTYGQRGDPMGVLWWLWWFKFAFARHMPSNPMTWVGVPFGRNISPTSRDPLTTLTLRALSIATTETVAYNIFLLLAFFFAAVAMYYLVRRLTASRGAATVAGFTFAFCPYMLMHGKEHIGLVPIAFIPLVFYFALRAWKERSLLMAASGVAAFILMTLFNYHYGLIGATLLVAFALSAWLLGRPWESGKEGSALARALPVLLCFAGVIALIVFIYVRRDRVGSDLTGLYLYSARPWDYFLPHAQGAALGWITGGFIRSHLHGGFLVENSLYVGIVTAGFAIYSLYGIWKGRGGRDHSDEGDGDGAPEQDTLEPEVAAGDDDPAGPYADSRIPVAFAITAAVCFLFSLPPTAKILGLKLYFPSYVLHYLVPDVRAYSRFGLGVLFSLAITAAYGIAMLLRKKEWAKHLWATVAVICIVVLLEFTIVPPFRSLDTASTTDYYRWLEGQPAGTVVALYPYFYADDFANYNYYFDQRHHEKKMVNGSEPETEAEKIRQIALDLTDPQTPGILERLTVKYVMAIPSLYRQGNHVNYIEPSTFDPADVARGLKRVKSFSDCVVYEVDAAPAKILPLFDVGAYQAVVYPDGKAWHPGAREMLVNVKSELGDAVVADVSFEAAATKEEGTISFEMNGVGSQARALSVWPSRYTLKAVRILPGSNLLAIHTDAKLSPVTEIPGATEVQAAVMVSDIDVVTAP